MEINQTPHAIDVELNLLYALITYPNSREEVPFLKAEHFYSEKNQIIYSAIQQVESVNIATIHTQLKSTKLLAKAGGLQYLVSLTNYYLNMAQVEHFARILQQFYIKRELIRVAQETMSTAYDPTSDCFDVLDDFTKNMEGIDSVLTPTLSFGNIISTIDNERESLEQAMKGEVKTGLSTGFEDLDKHFRFKPNSFVIINGHDNVGKTYIMLYLAVVSNHLHNWKWILCCMENNEARIRQDLMQFKSGKHISKLTPVEYQILYKWATDNFTILRISSEMNADRLLQMASKLCKQSHYDGFFIDPYNALDITIKDKWMTSHEYHYQVTSRMRNFVKNHNCCIYLSTHAVTEALRKLHTNGEYNGFPMPPQKADVEGGGKFSNRADDFITVHRYSQHTTDFNQTHIHIRKIKDTETGGRPTTIDDPIRLRVQKGYFGFFDMDGRSPILSLP